ncbi:hypothetical protein ACA910_011456 [Epithemia clementina (nom. ined.)]
MMVLEYTHSISSDDGSISSTVDVNEALLKSSFNATKSSRRRSSCRRVCFEETANLSYQSPFEDRYETTQFWYTADDYQRFKGLHMDALKMVISAERENKHDSQSFIRVLERVYEACCRLDLVNTPGVTPNDSQRLCELLSVEYFGRVGLERTSVRRIRMDKKFRRQEMVDAVLETQEDLARTCASPSQKARSLALVAQEISRPSRLFAVHLAMAAAAEQQ